MTAQVPERPGIFIKESLTPLTGNINVPGEAVGVFAANFNIGPDVPTFIKSWNAFTQRYGTFAQAAGNTALHYAAYQFFNNGGTGCYILALPNTDSVAASLIFQDVNSPTDSVLTASAISPGGWGNNIYVAITSAGNSGRFNVQVYNGGTAASNLAENFVDVSINPSDPRNVLSIINSPSNGSSYINMAATLPGTYEPGVFDPAFVNPTALSGGSNGVTPPNLSESIPTYLDMLQGQVLNLNIPGVNDPSTINTLVSWAEGRGDVMLVVDGPVPSPPETSAQVVQNYLNMITGGSPINTSTYVTIYAPWIQISDPASSLTGATIWVPPGGAVLGIWSRTDNLVGPWQTPAGTSYGQINLINLEALFTSSDLDTLNFNNINALRFVPNYFPAIMGGRTLERGYPDLYISVRRMLIKLEHDFTYLLQFALFEPNDQLLWTQITNVLTIYLTQLAQSNALGGVTPNTAFQIICDDTNNTPASSTAGIVNVSVAVALLSPAEFIMINISQFQNTGATTITTTP